MLLKDKHIVVTGAASGIGAESARFLKAQGATVIGVDLNEPAESIGRYIKADLSDPSSISKAVEEIPKGVDAICAAIGVTGSEGPTSPAMAVCISMCCAA